MPSEKIFEMYIISEGDINKARENADFYSADEILDDLVGNLEEYNNLQSDRIELFVTKDCYQVHVDGKPIFEYRGPDARSFAASTRVHGILLDDSPNPELVMLAGWWGYQKLQIEENQFCTRSIHDDLIAVWGDNWEPVQNLRD